MGTGRPQDVHNTYITRQCTQTGRLAARRVVYVTGDWLADPRLCEPRGRPKAWFIVWRKIREETPSFVNQASCLKCQHQRNIGGRWAGGVFPALLGLSAGREREQ